MNDAASKSASVASAGFVVALSVLGAVSFSILNVVAVVLSVVILAKSKGQRGRGLLAFSLACLALAVVLRFALRP